MKNPEILENLPKKPYFILNKKLEEDNLKKKKSFVNNLFVKFFLENITPSNENNNIFQIISDQQTSFF